MVAVIVRLPMVKLAKSVALINSTGESVTVNFSDFNLVPSPLSISVSPPVSSLSLLPPLVFPPLPVLPPGGALLSVDSVMLTLTFAERPDAPFM